MMKKYAEVQLEKYRLTSKLDERGIAVAVQYAVDYEVSVFKSNFRYQGEAAALQILAENIEDAEKAVAQAKAQK